MWKARKEDDMPPSAAEPTPVRATQVVPAAPATESPGGEVATIGKSVVVKGELSGSEDLYVDGEVEGSISLRGQSLVVGPNGRVRANIEARVVVVLGKVDGNIMASDRVDLRQSASLTGDMTTARVAIEDGAYFKGTIDIMKPESVARSEVKPQPVPASTGPASVGSSNVEGTLPNKF